MQGRHLLSTAYAAGGGTERKFGVGYATTSGTSTSSTSPNTTPSTSPGSRSSPRSSEAGGGGAGWRVAHTVAVPPGDDPCVLVEVAITNEGTHDRTVTW